MSAVPYDRPGSWRPAAGVANYRIRLATLLPAMQLAYVVLIWPLIYARGTVTADLATGPMPETQSFLLNRLFFPALAAMAVLILLAERRRLARFHLAGLVLLTALFCYLGLTTLWALAPSVTLSKFALLAITVTSLAVAVLLAPRVDDLVRPIFWVMAATVAINLVAVAALPPTPIGYAGIYAHKNTLGAMSALAGLFAFYGITRRNGRMRAAGVAMLPAALLLLYLSQSKTSLGLFLSVPPLALAVVLVQRAFRVPVLLTVLVSVVPAVFVLAGGVPGLSVGDISLAVSGDDTFTGRTDLWHFALSAIAERPLQGFGYQSFWQIGDLSPALDGPDGFLRRTPHAHNGYLDLLLQGGAILLALFCAALAMAVGWAGRLADRDPGAGFFAIAVLLFLIVLDLLETVWLEGLSASGTIAILFILMAAVRRGRSPLA